MSPASHLIVSCNSNVLLCWQSDLCTTRIMPNCGEEVEVVLHEDSTVLYIRERGNFVTHFGANLEAVPHIRKFTCDTVPISVSACNNSLARIYLQDALVTAFLLLKLDYSPNEEYALPES